MKILVFSDSHGKPAALKKAIELHPDARGIIHAGDGIKDLDLIENKPPVIAQVKGNFEDAVYSARNADSSCVIDVDDVRIFVSHGHRYNVSFGMTNLIYAARENKADLVIFGHTHVKYNKYVPCDEDTFRKTNGIFLFNPGSISRPRDSLYPSYGILEIRNRDILLSHGTV